MYLDNYRIKDETARHRESSTAYGFPVRHLTNALWSTERERSGIFSTAYLMFTKALQPRSAFDPDLLGPYSVEQSSPGTYEPSVVPGPYGDAPPNPFARD
jgi:hypothetical protein